MLFDFQIITYEIDACSFRISAFPVDDLSLFYRISDYNGIHVNDFLFVHWTIHPRPCLHGLQEVDLLNVAESFYR